MDKAAMLAGIVEDLCRGKAVAQTPPGLTPEFARDMQEAAAAVGLSVYEFIRIANGIQGVADELGVTIDDFLFAHIPPAGSA